MNQYGVRDVEKLLGLPRSTIRGLIKAGFVAPARGPRKAFLFSFQDLIVLRAARALSEASLSSRRITQSLKRLRRLLPEAMPLSGLSICAVGDRVIVREGGNRWQAESGQYLLALEVEVSDGMLRVIERGEPAAEANAEHWFSQGWALEEVDAQAAQDAYERALAADPAHLGAAINLGRMLHETGRLAEAEQVYRSGLTACGSDTLLHYNLGVLLEDRDGLAEAASEYEAALRDDPDMADGHYNLARVYEALGKPRQAIRHLARYRKLAGDV
ncbi:MAG: tetratricopeptide repeat protein [Thiobacillaceae bacterium]